jgi:hypothetical protein
MYHVSKTMRLGIVIFLSLVLVVCVLWYTMSRITTGSTEHAVKTSVGMGEGASMQYATNDMAIREERGDVRTVSPGIAPSPDMDGSVVAPEATERLIIRNGSLSVVVDDVRAAVSTVHQIAADVGGFVVSSNIYEYEAEAPSAHVSIRIPATDFDAGVSSLRALGQVEHESMTGRDVTEEYVDLKAQLGNLEATEAQFLSIMTRATEISDVLAVQRELSNVRREIERIEGRLQYLEESAAYSLITVSLATDPKELPLVEEGEWRPLVELRQALRSLVSFGQGIVSALIWLAIYAPVWIIVFFVGRFVYRKWVNTMS